VSLPDQTTSTLITLSLMAAIDVLLRYCRKEPHEIVNPQADPRRLSHHERRDHFRLRRPPGDWRRGGGRDR
jgi:hypothetical protein